jgi:hypothetical protein
MKGIIFGGCSFTWGQGLYFYSDLVDLKYPESEYVFNQKEITDAQIKFKNTLYYPRLVANHFNTFEVTKKDNGGSEDKTFDFFNNIFNCDLLESHEKRQYLKLRKYEYIDFDYMIIQISHIFRNNFNFELDGVNYVTNVAPILENRNENNQKFFEWFDSNDYTFNEWEKIQIENQYIRLKKELMFYEEKGIKTKILSWENDIVSYIKNDDFLNNRFIDLTYNGVTYQSIKDLQENNKDMVIKTDFDNFGPNPPLDHHPSKLCHQVIAENIIKNIEKDLK